MSPRKGSYRHSTMFLRPSVCQSVTKPIFGFSNYNILLFSTHYNFLGLLDDFATLLKFFCTFFAIFCKLAKTLFFGYFWLLLVTSCNSGFFLAIFAICFANFCKFLQFLNFFGIFKPFVSNFCNFWATYWYFHKF